ncbi:phage late control D family protein [Undibacterium arcticum]
MALNPTVQSIARQPRGVVKVNDTRLDGWIKWEVDNNTYYEADTFRVTFALSALPAACGDAWWASQQEIFIEIFAGFPADAENYSATELQSLTYGRVDDVTFDPVARTLQVSGRDLTAMLIDAKTSETFQNLTSSQIATQIAQRHGLTTTYVTATSKRSGKYYQIDQVRVNQQRSEWDLLTALAGEEEFSVYVKRKELHFEPVAQPSANPYLLKWEPPTDQNGAFGFNGQSISFSRALNFARGVVVTVMSVSPKTGQAIKVIYPAKAANIKPGQSKAQAQQFSYTFAHLTYEKALQKAQQIHDDISKHEVKLNATLPADNLIQVNNLISVVGTGTAFDQTYYPESIVREMDLTGGYTMTIKAKNHSPQSVIPL